MKLGYIKNPAEPRRKTKRCPICAGQPHARRPDRFCREDVNGKLRGSVVGPDGKCRGCGGVYEPEDVRFAGSLIGSSAATCVNYGRIYGERINNGKGR